MQGAAGFGGEPLPVFECAGFSYRCVQHGVALPEMFSSHCVAALERWVEAFPVERTLARESLGVPAVLVRIDATSREDGSPAIFEIEDRPSGIGLTCALNPGFAARPKALRSSLASVCRAACR